MACSGGIPRTVSKRFIIHFSRGNSCLILCRYPDYELYVYTGDLDSTPADILKRVNNIFNIPVKDTVKFVYLHRRKWVEASMYPYFTLLGQSLGSVYLGFEALTQLQPGMCHYHCYM